MSVTTLARGRTANGQQILAVEGEDATLMRSVVSVYVNMKPVRVIRVDVLRDGGSRVIKTEAGTLTLPHRMNDPDREPRWDGELI